MCPGSQSAWGPRFAWSRAATAAAWCGWWGAERPSVTIQGGLLKITALYGEPFTGSSVYASTDDLLPRATDTEGASSLPSLLTGGESVPGVTG